MVVKTRHCSYTVSVLGLLGIVMGFAVAVAVAVAKSIFNIKKLNNKEYVLDRYIYVYRYP